MNGPDAPHATDDAWSGLEPVQPKAQTRTFVVEDADTICARDGDWLVKGLWPRVGLCFIAGPSMSGKSFLVLQLMSDLANGRLVLGKPQ
jgi:hypothetical protein